MTLLVRTILELKRNGDDSVVPTYPTLSSPLLTPTLVWYICHNSCTNTGTSPESIQTSLVLIECPFSVLELHPGYHITFSCHSQEAPWVCDSSSDFYLRGPWEFWEVLVRYFIGHARIEIGLFSYNQTGIMDFGEKDSRHPMPLYHPSQGHT